MIEALEKEAQHNDISMNASNNIFTVFIELSQNMINYSKSVQVYEKALRPQGLILVVLKR